VGELLATEGNNLSVVAFTPGLSWTTAYGVSPHFSLGCATTAAIGTAGRL